MGVFFSISFLAMMYGIGLGLVEINKTLLQIKDKMK